MSLPLVPASKQIPFEGQGRRVAMACSNCRRHKIKCRPTAGTSSRICERCKLRGLTCEYVPVAEQEELGPPATTIPAAPSSDTRRERRAPPPQPYPGPLPYTGPPPFNQRPRYAGQPKLPDLSLPSTHFAQPNPALPGPNQGPMDPRYSSSLLSGWAGNIPGPSSSSHNSPPYTQDNSPRINSPLGQNQGYHLPVRAPSNRPPPAQTLGAPQTGNPPVNYPMQYFDPSSVSQSASAHDP
ncbi:hypothetical protein FB451DRAFT_1182929 [Mycena latifolia]|nr:hypothetical protein FB451DRAFT_1182929 [Mycena latifolia]